MKNMTQNRFFIEKYVILGIKLSKIEIWKFLQVIYLNVKNALKMFWMRFLLQGASLSIIPQKSSIGQKFLPFHSPKKHRYVIKKFSYSKKFWNLHLFWFFFKMQGVRNFWPIGDFWGMMLSDANCKKNRIQNIFRVFFMCKNGKRTIFEHSKIIKFYVINFVFCVPGGCTYSECHLRDINWQL